jgi:hypothetical protein
MSKTAIRYFFDFTEKQEKWLNDMASQGLRLVRCGQLTYTFDECAANEYQYCVEFAGEKSYSKHKDYKKFLEGLGYRVIPKNISLSWSVGKVRFRPWGEGAGMLATSPGAYNKELFIVEKRNDGKPFDLHTDTEDLAARFKTLRNVYGWVAIIGLLGAVASAAVIITRFDLTWSVLAAWCGVAALGLAGAVYAFFCVKYAHIAKRYKELAKTNE